MTEQRIPHQHCVPSTLCSWPSLARSRPIHRLWGPSEGPALAHSGRQAAYKAAIEVKHDRKAVRPRNCALQRITLCVRDTVLLSVSRPPVPCQGSVDMPESTQAHARPSAAQPARPVHRERQSSLVCGRSAAIQHCQSREQQSKHPLTHSPSSLRRRERQRERGGPQRSRAPLRTNEAKKNGRLKDSTCLSLCPQAVFVHE